MQLHLAKTIITNNKEPIYNGALLIEDQKIINIGKKEDFGKSIPKENIFDHGESLICPGFINLHCHLLYSKVNKINGEDGLFPWLGNLVDSLSSWSQEDYIDSVNFGITQALQSGTTFIVENTPYPEISIQGLFKNPLKALIGIEVFGSDESKAEEDFVKSLNKLSARNIEFTLSPHAPYDVSVPLWKRLVEWADKNNKPLLTHLEESLEEKNWWQTKSARAIDFWRKINKLEPKLKYWKRYNSGIDFLHKNNLLSKSIIATHLCQATKEDLTLLKKFNINLVHSPRSNFYLNNGTANLKIWDELELMWGIGTDSIASNKDLDLLEEIRFTINNQKNIYNYSISAKETFQSITSSSAKILNKELEIGTLKKGYWADFLIFDIKDKSLCKYNDPYEMIVFGLKNGQHLKEVWINGKRAYLQNLVLHKI